jgi:hypothetical protein
MASFLRLLLRDIGFAFNAYTVMVDRANKKWTVAMRLAVMVNLVNNIYGCMRLSPRFVLSAKPTLRIALSCFCKEGHETLQLMQLQQKILQLLFGQFLRSH